MRRIPLSILTGILPTTQLISLKHDIEKEINFCPFKENRSLLSSRKSLINSLKHGSCTRAPLDPGFPGLSPFNGF
jgi:hypothetical protein